MRSGLKAASVSFFFYGRGLYCRAPVLVKAAVT